MDTANIKRTFDSLIKQLQEIKDLNDIAKYHKDNTSLLAEKLQEFYENSKEYYSIVDVIKSEHLKLNKKIEQSNERIEQSNEKINVIIKKINTLLIVSIVLFVIIIVLLVGCYGGF